MTEISSARRRPEPNGIAPSCGGCSTSSGRGIRPPSIVWTVSPRSQLHLLQILEEIEGKGAKLVSLMDNIDTGTATGKMVVGVLAVLAEFERNLLMERCAAGVKIARQRNVRFGRPPKLTSSLIRQVLLAHDDASTTVPET